jgi:hypothetical protein
VLSPEAASSRAIRQLARTLSGESATAVRADQRQGFLARLAGFLGTTR